MCFIVFFRVTALDAVVFGHLFAIVTTILPNNCLSVVIKDFDNLQQFLRRINETYFSEEKVASPQIHARQYLQQLSASLAVVSVSNYCQLCLIVDSQAVKLCLIVDSQAVNGKYFLIEQTAQTARVQQLTGLYSNNEMSCSFLQQSI